MEAVFSIIGLVLFWVAVNFVFQMVRKVLGATVNTVTGKGSFSDNMAGPRPFEMRLVDSRFGEDGEGPRFKALEVKGIFPVPSMRRKVNAGFVISVLDITDDEPAPVFSAMELFQEPETVVYQHKSEIGAISGDEYFVSWARAGAVIPDLLEPPYGGKRTLSVVLRIVDLDNMPPIVGGFCDSNHAGVLAVKILKFDHYFSEKGYREASEERDRARALSIQIGMAVAMADGSLDDTEGQVLKEWISKAISPFDDDKREALKALYNNAMSDAYDLAREGNLVISALTQELNDLAEKSGRYETIELCFDIMAADGVADPEEMRTIQKIAEALDLDFAEIEKLRDQKLVELDTSTTAHASIEDLLGIDKGWDESAIKKHLRLEFQKWNNRLNTLSEGEERENAQRMLDLIADARKKYS